MPFATETATATRRPKAAFLRACVLVVLCGAVVSTQPFFAQAPAPVQSAPAEQPMWHGRLHNAAGAPIASAKVHLRGQSQSATALTANDGGFRVEPLAPGSYKLTIEANGRTMQYGQGIDIEPGAP